MLFVLFYGDGRAPFLFLLLHGLWWLPKSGYLVRPEILLPQASVVQW